MQGFSDDELEDAHLRCMTGSTGWPPKPLPAGSPSGVTPKGSGRGGRPEIGSTCKAAGRGLGTWAFDAARMSKRLAFAPLQKARVARAARVAAVAAAVASANVLGPYYHERWQDHLEFCLRSKSFYTGSRHYKTRVLSFEVYVVILFVEGPTPWFRHLGAALQMMYFATWVGLVHRKP